MATLNQLNLFFSDTIQKNVDKSSEKRKWNWSVQVFLALGSLKFCISNGNMILLAIHTNLIEK